MEADKLINHFAMDGIEYKLYADSVISVMESNDYQSDRDLCLEILNHHSGQHWKRTSPKDDSIVLETYGEGAPGNPVMSIPDFTGSLQATLDLFRTGITSELRPIMWQYPDGQWCVTFDYGAPQVNAPRVYGEDLTRTVLIAGLLSAEFLLTVRI